MKNHRKGDRVGASVEDRLSKLEASVNAMKKTMDKHTEKMSAISSRLDTFTPHTVEKYLNSMQKEAGELHRRLRLEIDKICVVTELCFMARRDSDNPNALHEIQSACVWSLDQPEKFWHGKPDVPLRDLRHKILEEYRRRAA